MRRLYGRGKLPAFSGKDSCSRNLTALFTALEKPLHSQTDSEKWSLGGNAVQQSFVQASLVQSSERREVSYPRKDNLVRCGYEFRLVGYHDWSAEMVECLLHRI